MRNTLSAVLVVLLFTACSEYSKQKKMNLLPVVPTETSATVQAQSWILYNCYHEQSAISVDNSTIDCPFGILATTPSEHPLEFIDGLWILHLRVLHNYPPNIDSFLCRINLEDAAALRTGDEGFYGYFAGGILSGVNCEAIGLHDIYLGEVTEDFTEIICIFEPEGWDCLCSAPNDLVIPVLLDCECE